MNNIWNQGELLKLSDLQKHISEVNFNLSNTQYEFIENIGTGAYGIVCQAKNNKNNRDYAIKKIKNPFCHKVTLIRTLREIRILNHFNHINIVNIVDIFLKEYNSSKDIYVVFDLMESDLHKIIISKQDLSDDHIRYFMYQMLCGVNYIHSASVIHRDLKPANILINSNCHLKIADFGMARLLAAPLKFDSKFSETAITFNMTQYVMTRWYRSPELLMGQLSYNTKIDLWSCGCILAELYLKKPLFRGDNMINQLKEIIQNMGTPSTEFRIKVLPIVNSLINAEGDLRPKPLNQMVPTAPKKVIDLLSHLLVYDPDQRWSALQSLKHIFFLKYKNPSKEEVCKSVLDLSFEVKLNTIDLLKDALLNDILSTNPNAFNTSDVTTKGKSQSKSFEETNHNQCQTNVYKCELSNRSTSPISDRTLSADSDNELGYPVPYFDSDRSLPRQSCASELSENNRLKTVSQFTKTKLINSIRKPKDKSVKKVITAAQRQKERQDRKLKLKHKRDEKNHTKRLDPSLLCQDQLSDLDKSFLKKWEHLSNPTIDKNNFIPMENNNKNCVGNHFIDPSQTSNVDINVKSTDHEVQDMSAGLSALLLLDDITESGTVGDDKNAASSAQLTDINLSNDNFDLWFDVDIDCIELDLNLLESYSSNLFKDESRTAFN